MIARARPASRGQKAPVAGFTLLELVVVLCVIGATAAIAADRFLYWEERAEQAAVDLVLAGVKMGLQIRMAEMLMTNAQREVATLESQNPLAWLEQPPANYGGEYSAPGRTGYWYYAAKEHELVYLPVYSTYLETGQTGRKELWFRIAVRYETSAITGGRVPVSISVVPVHRYKWF